MYDTVAYFSHTHILSCTI